MMIKFCMQNVENLIFDKNSTFWQNFTMYLLEKIKMKWYKSSGTNDISERKLSIFCIWICNDKNIYNCSAYLLGCYIMTNWKSKKCDKIQSLSWHNSFLRLSKNHFFWNNLRNFIKHKKNFSLYPNLWPQIDKTR